MDAGVTRYIVAVILQRRRIEGKQPDRGDAEVVEVLELLGKPAEVPDAVPVAIVESADVDLIEDRVLVPEWIAAEFEGFFFAILHGLTK